MTNTQKTLVGSLTLLLMAFVAFSIYTWIRVIQVIPHSSGSTTTWIQISRRNAFVRPFFLIAFVAGTVVFELFRRDLPRSWRLIYLVTLGLSAAAIAIPWIIAIVSS